MFLAWEHPFATGVALKCKKKKKKKKKPQKKKKQKTKTPKTKQSTIPLQRKHRTISQCLYSFQQPQTLFIVLGLLEEKASPGSCWHCAYLLCVWSGKVRGTEKSMEGLRWDHSRLTHFPPFSASGQQPMTQKSPAGEKLSTVWGSTMCFISLQFLWSMKS